MEIEAREGNYEENILIKGWEGKRWKVGGEGKRRKDGRGWKEGRGRE